MFRKEVNTMVKLGVLIPESKSTDWVNCIVLYEITNDKGEITKIQVWVKIWILSDNFQNFDTKSSIFLRLGLNWMLFMLALVSTYPTCMTKLKKGMFTRREGYPSKQVTIALTHFLFNSLSGLQGSYGYQVRQVTHLHAKVKHWQAG